MDWNQEIYNRASQIKMETLQARALMDRMDNDALINITKKHKAQVETGGDIANAVQIMSMPGWGYGKTGKGK